jgi:CotH kinase protein
MLLGSVALLLGCGAPHDQVLEDQIEEGDVTSKTQLLTEYAPNQAKVNNFYAFDNVIDITVNLSDATWTAIKTENPNPPPPNNCSKLPVGSNGESPDRYPWRSAGSVTVKDSKGNINTTFSSGVEIRKKSYCGSLTTGANEKPSLKLKIGSSTATSTLGLQYIDLNNSKQDPSYIRQTLGYWLFGLAGLPHSRANYAKVHVVTPTKTEDLVYVNVEPIRGSFIGNPDNGFTNRTITQSGSSDAKAKGNVYEFQLNDDISAAALQYISLEKISAIQSTSKPDLTFAATRLGTNTVTGLSDVINVDQFAKFWAMEVLMKHWDGYSIGGNNTYVYNDVVATSGAQSAATVDFKFIPWGIDQILLPGANFDISEAHLANKISRNDTATYNKFLAAVEQIRLNVLSRSMLDGTIKTRIDTLRSQLISLGLDKTAEIDQVRVQLKLARAAAIMLTGSGSAAFYLADVNTGDVLHASNSETVGIYYEVYHRQPLDDPSDRWILGSNSSGLSFTSEAYGRPLYATASMKTAAGHYYMLTEPAGNYVPGEAWIYPYNYTTYPDGRYRTFTGTFKLRSLRTSRYAHFSTSSDLTPAGRPRVYQGATDGSDATNMFMY